MADIRVNNFPAPARDAGDESNIFLSDLYSYARQSAIDAIDWYMHRKWWMGLIARTLRSSAILLTTIGGIIPLLVAGELLGTHNDSYKWSQLGYVSLLLAAGCILFDKFFGFSSGWMRYVTTALKLQH